MVTTVVNEIDILFLQTRHQSREIFLASGDPIEEHHVSVGFLEVVLHGTRQAFTILLFVVNDRNALRLHFFNDIFGSSRALIGIQTGGT